MAGLSQDISRGRPLTADEEREQATPHLYPFQNPWALTVNATGVKDGNL